MSLPKEIFVTNEHPEQEGGWYSCNLSLEMPSAVQRRRSPSTPEPTVWSRKILLNWFGLSVCVKPSKAKQPKTKK